MAKKETQELPPVVDPEKPVFTDDNGNPIETETETVVEPEAPVKRGRGRPRKSDSEKSSAKDSPKKSKARIEQDTQELGIQLVGLHKLAAMVTGLPELEISPMEGALLAGGINAVCQEYGLSLSGKTGAAVQLFGALSVVYVPRVVVIQKRQAAERAKKDEERTVDVPATVTTDHAATFN